MNRRDMLWTSAVLVGGAVFSRPAFAQDAEAEKKAIAKIREIGGLVLEIAQNDKRLDVSYITAQAKVTDEHLAPLKDLSKLANLNLRGTEVTDAGLANIAGAKELVRLHLEKTKITDKGLEHLKGLEKLEYLNVYGDEITDAGLEQIPALKGLKSLYVWQTKVTDAGVEKLQKAMPMLKIVRGT